MAGTRNPPRNRRRVDATWLPPKSQGKFGKSASDRGLSSVCNVAGGSEDEDQGGEKESPVHLAESAALQLGSIGISAFEEEIVAGSMSQGQEEPACGAAFVECISDKGLLSVGRPEIVVGSMSQGQEETACGAAFVECISDKGLLSVGRPEIVVGSMSQGQEETACGAAFLERIPDKILHCVRSVETDVHSFAKQVVGQVLEILSQEAGAGAGERCAVLGELVKALLKPTDGLAESAAQEIRLAELAICFRLEIMCAFTAEWEEEHSTLLDQVCDVLDSIQFVLEDENLLEYADRVVRSRYGAIVPEAVERIYREAELQGYNDQSGSSDSPAEVAEGRIIEDMEIPISLWHCESTLALSLEKSIRAVRAMGTAQSSSGQPWAPRARKEIFSDPSPANRGVRKEIFKAPASVEDLLKEQRCAQRLERARKLSHFGNSRLVEKLMTILPKQQPMPAQKRKKEHGVWTKSAAMYKAVPPSLPETPIASSFRASRLMVLETPLTTRSKNFVLSSSTPSALRRCGTSVSSPKMVVTPRTAAKAFQPVLATPRRTGASPALTMVTPKTAANTFQPVLATPRASRPLMMVTPRSAAKTFQPVLATPRRAGPSRPLMMVTPKSAAKTFQPVMETPRRAGPSRPLMMVTPNSAAKAVQPVLGTPRRAGRKSVHFSGVTLSATVPASEVCSPTIPGLQVPEDAGRNVLGPDVGNSVPLIEETGGSEAQNQTVDVAFETNDRSNSSPAKDLGAQETITNPLVGEEIRADDELERGIQLPLTVQQVRLKKLTRKRPIRFQEPRLHETSAGSAQRQRRTRSLA